MMATTSAVILAEFVNATRFEDLPEPDGGFGSDARRQHAGQRRLRPRLRLRSDHPGPRDGAGRTADASVWFEHGIKLPVAVQRASTRS